MGEALLAIGISTILIGAAAFVLKDRRAQRREAEVAEVLLGFVENYIELLRNQPGESIGHRRPLDFLNSDIEVPLRDKWVALNDPRYLEFYPDLARTIDRDPWLKVVISETVDQLNHPRGKHLRVEVGWRSAKAMASSRDSALGGGQPDRFIVLDATVFRERG